MTTTKRKWTAAEVQKLITMAKNCLGQTEIAFVLNRSIASVQGVLAEHLRPSRAPRSVEGPRGLHGTRNSASPTNMMRRRLSRSVQLRRTSVVHTSSTALRQHLGSASLQDRHGE